MPSIFFGNKQKCYTAPQWHFWTRSATRSEFLHNSHHWHWRKSLYEEFTASNQPDNYEMSRDQKTFDLEQILTKMKKLWMMCPFSLHHSGRTWHTQLPCWMSRSFFIFCSFMICPMWLHCKLITSLWRSRTAVSFLTAVLNYVTVDSELRGDGNRSV